jgi:hypothetical protein
LSRCEITRKFDDPLNYGAEHLIALNDVLELTQNSIYSPNEYYYLVKTFLTLPINNRNKLTQLKNINFNLFHVIHSNILELSEQDQKKALDLATYYINSIGVSLNSDEFNQFLDILLLIPVNQWENALDEEQKIFDQLCEDSGYEKSYLDRLQSTQAFIGLSDIEKKALVDDTKKISPKVNRDFFNIITRLSLIPMKIRKELIDTYWEQLARLDAVKRTRMLELFFKAPHTEKNRERFSHLLTLCAQVDIYLPENDTITLEWLYTTINFIYKINIYGTQTRHMVNSILQINDDREMNYRLNRVLERRRTNPDITFEKMLSIIETPFNEELPVVGHRVNYANGINVHERDQQVRDAWTLLQAHQGNLEFEPLVNEFINYVNQQPESDRKSKILRALNGPAEAASLFPSLMEGEFSIVGLMMTGNEVIARLWHYISQITNPDDKEAAKTAMLNGLSRCFNEGGSRICNPGKVQHLVIAVLQGRLNGVQIDEVPEDDDIIVVVPTTLAINSFFLNPDHMALLDDEKFEELLQAAGKFADENPGIDRKKFFDRIAKSFAPTRLTVAERNAVELLKQITLFFQQEEQIRETIHNALADGRDIENLLDIQRQQREALEALAACPDEEILYHYTRVHNERYPEEQLTPAQLLTHYRDIANEDLRALPTVQRIRRLENLIVEQPEVPRLQILNIEA